MAESTPQAVRNSTTAALETALANGDIEFLYQLFANNAREMAQTGQGRQLIKLSRFAGDESLDGLALRKSFAMMGYLVELDFETAAALAMELEIEKQKTNINDFTEKMIAFVRAYILFNKGDLNQAKSQIELALNAPVLTTDLGAVDKPGLVRLSATTHHIYANLEELRKCQNKVEELIDKHGGVGIAHHLVAIKALVYYEEGNFLKSFEYAKLGLSSSEANGYVGVSAALDCKYILARSLFEFGKLDQALIELEELKTYAKSSKSLFWYVIAQTSVIRINCAQYQVKLALEKLARLTTELEDMSQKSDLVWLLDITELFIRYTLNDRNRVEQLLKRCPELPYVWQVRKAFEEKLGRTQQFKEIIQLPEKTYRQQIYKNLFLSEFKNTPGNNSKKQMKKALEIGELVGSREVFIRQGEHHLALMIEISKEKPSLYLEELIRECIARNLLKTESENKQIENLTNREIDVLKHLASGKSIDQVGRGLHISKNTMKTHLRNIYRKLEVSGRGEAIKKGKELFII